MPRLFNPKVSRSTAGLGDGPGTLFSPYIDDRDLIEASGAMFQLAGWLEDVSVPLNSAKEIARHDMEQRFVRQVDPNGKPWAPLSDNYVLEKMRDGFPILPILTRTTDLRTKATDRSAWFVAGDTVYFNTANLPPYWAAHQQRGGRLPWVEDKVSKSGLEFREVKGGMPQRAFIGLSEDAEKQILVMMDQWLSGGLYRAETNFRNKNLIQAPSGMKFASKGAGGKLQWRTSSGRFGPMV